jgi:D-amino-acid dehydrogenase
MNKNIKVGIVGAGIQGVSNALFLQKKGFNVTIFDRDNPGSQQHHMEMQVIFLHMLSSINRPDVLADVPAMLLSSSGPLALKWNYVPKMIPWFLKFIMNSLQKK